MRRPRSSDEGDDARPTANARVVALRLLAQRRLTETQVWTRLARRGYREDEVGEAIAFCKRHGFIDDRVFAQLFVDGRAKAVGDARLVADLVKRGIDREAAMESVASAESLEASRLEIALDKLYRTRANLSYPSAARALERLGFPAPAIYRELRTRAQAQFADLGADVGDDSSP